MDPMVAPGTLLYCTSRRDPIDRDLVLIVFADNHVEVRSLVGIGDKGVVTRLFRHVSKKGARDLFEMTNETTTFDNILEIAVVAGSNRIS